MSTVLSSLNDALHQAFQADERVYLLGEDVLDPYGGAFKVAKGLSTAYLDRVLTTPISEASIVGAAAGMALRGLRPVVEIMFGDFITLAADQIINSIAKFPWMYGQEVPVPLVIRTPMGGRRGYGPTHSQTLEKHFLGVPGLRVLTPTALGDPGGLLSKAILKDNGPVLFIENKLLYTQPLFEESEQSEFSLATYTAPDTYAPAYTLTIRDAPPPMLTLAAYGYMAELGRQAIQRLAYEHEIFAELVVPTQLAPFGVEGELPEPLLASLRRTGHLLTLEEGSYSLGWGAEIVARATEMLGPALNSASRVAALDLPIPASMPLEAQVLPGVEAIIEAAQKVV